MQFVTSPQAYHYNHYKWGWFQPSPNGGFIWVYGFILLGLPQFTTWYFDVPARSSVIKNGWVYPLVMTNIAMEITKINGAL